jgi:hypothetical protein
MSARSAASAWGVIALSPVQVENVAQPGRRINGPLPVIVT